MPRCVLFFLVVALHGLEQTTLIPDAFGNGGMLRDANGQFTARVINFPDGSSYIAPTYGNTAGNGMGSFRQGNVIRDFNGNIRAMASSNPFGGQDFRSFDGKILGSVRANGLGGLTVFDGSNQVKGLIRPNIFNGVTYCTPDGGLVQATRNAGGQVSLVNRAGTIARSAPPTWRPPLPPPQVPQLQFPLARTGSTPIAPSTLRWPNGQTPKAPAQAVTSRAALRTAVGSSRMTSRGAGRGGGSHAGSTGRAGVTPAQVLLMAVVAVAVDQIDDWAQSRGGWGEVFNDAGQAVSDGFGGVVEATSGPPGTKPDEAGKARLLARMDADERALYSRLGVQPSGKPDAAQIEIAMGAITATLLRDQCGDLVDDGVLFLDPERLLTRAAAGDADAGILAAAWCERQGDWDRAADLLSHAHGDGRRSMSWRLLGNLLGRTDNPKGDVDVAVDCYRHAIALGDATAAVPLALLLLRTPGDRQRVANAIEVLSSQAEADEKEARFWRGSAHELLGAQAQAVADYLVAARAQHPAAIFRLGELRWQGSPDLAKDTALACSYFRRAAMLGDARAQLMIGICTETGVGTVRDIPAARRWYEAAAHQGVPEACRRLGDSLLLEKGNAMSLRLALHWFEVASLTGDREAPRRLVAAFAADGSRPDPEREAWWQALVEAGNSKEGR